MKKNRTKSANLQQHPIGAILPAMSTHDFKTLREGIKNVGFDRQHPIITFEGHVLDGWHRYKAAKEVGARPVFEKFKGDNPFEFVIQENLRRRNLTPSQAAMAGAELVLQMKASERANRVDGKEKNGARPARIRGSKSAHAAAALNVSERNVATARKVKKVNPKLAEDVKKGKKSLHAAALEVEKSESAEKQRSDEYLKSIDRIERLTNKAFAVTVGKKLKPKEVLHFADLEPAEVRRMVPFIESGWSLKAALGYKAQTLSYGHTLRQLRDRAIEQGGNYTLVMTDGWEITARNEALKATIPGL